MFERKAGGMLKMQVVEIGKENYFKYLGPTKMTDSAQEKCRMHNSKSEREGFKTCYDVQFGDNYTDKKTEGGAGSVQIFIGSDKNRQD